jgi:hypothetical protein
MREADENRQSTASIFGTADGGDALDANVGPAIYYVWTIVS